MEEKWVVAAQKADLGGIAKRFGIDPVTARVIRNRDVISEEDIRRFLNPTITDLYPSTALRGAQEAAGLQSRKSAPGKRSGSSGIMTSMVSMRHIFFIAVCRCAVRM